jgi:hypothetical protein
MSSLLTEGDVAERLHVSLASIRRWRLEQSGPQSIATFSTKRIRAGGPFATAKETRPLKGAGMISQTMHEIIEMIEAQAHFRPSPIEFEMAYQARVAIDCIRFAIKHAEQFSQPCDQMREASLHLLEALNRLEHADRRFRARCLGQNHIAKAGPA